MDPTVFFYDWNYNTLGYIWPGLVYSDTLQPYCRLDLSPDEREEEELNENIKFNNDPIEQPLTCLTAKHLLNGEQYQNEDPLTHVFTSSKYTECEIAFYDAEHTVGPFYFFDANKAIVRGKTASGNLLAIEHCSSKNIAYDDTRKKFIFQYNGTKYDFYVEGQTNELNNISSFAKDGSVVTFVPPPINKNIEVVFPQYVKSINDTLVKAVQHTSDIVALFADVPSVDKLNYYEEDAATGKLTNIEFHKSITHYGSEKLWTTEVFKEYEKIISDDTTASELLDDALSDVYNPWKTPDEFYNDFNPSETIITGDSGYAKVKTKKNETETEKENMPVWFWCNTLRNWCTFKHTKRHTLELCLWNGMNGWDLASKIILPENARLSVLSRYLYDVRRFIPGASFTAVINYDSMDFAYKSIKLIEDSKFSQYDTETFQTIKLGKTYINDKGTRRYPFSVGIPPIFRTTSGELCLLYTLTIPGMAKNVELIFEDQVDFVNSVCQAFFGKGEDKTVFQHWKRYNFVKDVSEENSTKVITDEDSTLIYQHEINTIHENNDVLNISFSIPRQYPEIQNNNDESYVESWSR